MRNSRILSLWLLLGCLALCVGRQAGAAPPVAGYLAWFDAQTAGGTNATQYTSWADGSASPHNATIGSGGPTWYNTGSHTINGKPAFSGWAGNTLTAATFGATVLTGYTVFVVAQHTSSSSTGVLVATGGTGNNYFALIGNNHLAESNTGSSTGASFAQADANCRLDNGPQIFVFRGGNGGLAQIRSCGLTVNSSAVIGTMTLTGNLSLGNLAGGGFAFNGDEGEIIVYPSVLSDAQVAQTMQYERTHWAFPEPTLIIGDGDSLMAGQDGGAQGDIISQLAYALTLGNAYEFYNFGIGGQAISEMNGTRHLAVVTTAQVVDVLFPYFSGKKILIGWAATNDLAFTYVGTSRAAENIIALLNTYATARKTAGATTVIWLSMIARADPSVLTTPTLINNFEVGRLAYNTALQADVQTGPDAVYAIGNDPTFGRQGAEYNPGVFYIDLGSNDKYVHLTNYGYSLVARNLVPLVKAYNH